MYHKAGLDSSCGYLLIFPRTIGKFLGCALLWTCCSYRSPRRVLYEIVTPLGKVLDPLADKLLVSVTMIMLITLNRVPAWIVMVIIAREIAVTGLRGIAVVEGKVIEASSLGKYKTIFQSVALILLCLHYQYLKVDCHAVGMTFLWVALILTLWSGWVYLRMMRKVLF